MRVTRGLLGVAMVLAGVGGVAEGAPRLGARAVAPVAERVPERASRVEATAPEWVQHDLSPEALGVRHFLSHITTDTRNAPDMWQEWWVNSSSQTGLDGVRYPLAFSAYASFLLGSRTPAYTELAAAQMRDAIERMLELQVWEYIEVYWASEPTFPDPIYIDNIMYSGHLLQMMTFYQVLTRDDRYATQGFDFVWKDGRRVHYDLHMLARRLYELSMAQPSGGIPCEPAMIFVYCQNPFAIGLELYDRLYPSYDFSAAVDRWRVWMERHAPFRVPAPAFFKIVYMTEYRAFAPYGEAGGDAWGLGWMVPWSPNSRFLEEGWQTLLESPQVRLDADGGAHLSASPVMDMMEVTETTASSFIPFLAMQMEGPDSNLSAQFFQYFDAWATWSDEDGDGVTETLAWETGIDRNVVTANLAAALALDDATQVQELIQVPEAVLGNGARLEQVDASRVDVTRAWWRSDGSLEMRLAPAGAPVSRTSVLVRSSSPLGAVTRDGSPWSGVRVTSEGTWIDTDLEGAHVFVVGPPTP